MDYLFATPLPPLRLFMGLALARASSGALSLLVPMAVYVLLVVEGAAHETLSTSAPAGSATTLLVYPLLCVAMYGAGLLWGVVLEDAELSGRGVRRWVAWGLWGWTAACLALLVGRAGWLAFKGVAPLAVRPMQPPLRRLRGRRRHSVYLRPARPAHVGGVYRVDFPHRADCASKRRNRFGKRRARRSA